MSDPTAPKYVDHPAPSAFLMIFLLVAICALIFGILVEIQDASGGAGAWLPVVALGVMLALLCFFFWSLYATYYALGPTGLVVRYGPWKRHYTWSEFVDATWRRGMFATRIGWPSVTPCVRLTDAVQLRRGARGLGLYLTPKDSRAFLRRVAEFAPDLTKQSIL